MDLLLRLLERRVIIGIVVVLASLWAAERWGGYAHSRADVMLHPPADAKSSLSASIIMDSEARESAKFKSLHRIVSAEIAAAVANGFKVERFQSIADNALKLDSPRYRSAAIERLNRLRLAIPQKREGIRPASDEDLNPETVDSPRPNKKVGPRR